MSAAHRHPPALLIPLRPQPRLALLVAGLVGLSAAALLAGLAAHDARALYLLPVLPLLLWLAWRGARIEPRRLQWDGQCWRLAAGGSPDPGPVVRLEVLIDLDRWLLLRAQTPHAANPLHRWRRIYLPLSQSGQGAAWGALRATLYSARPNDSVR
ncbi:MAG: hypothetical protein ABW005_10010 [Burkholderiaceae bacterium]